MPKNENMTPNEKTTGPSGRQSGADIYGADGLTGVSALDSTLDSAAEPRRGTEANGVQTTGEEIANAITHGIGAVLSVAGLTLLVVMALLHGDGWRLAGVTVFGITLVFLYLASTLYHAIQSERAKKIFHQLDHIGIAFLIAGTYTPILLVKMRDTQGMIVFAAIWTLALIAAGIKIFFTNRYRVISTSVYLIMGWLAILVARPLIDALGYGGLAWMLAGGLAYSIGIVPFLWNRMPYNHAVWHIFVMAGSVLHFLAIYWYVLLA